MYMYLPLFTAVYCLDNNIHKAEIWNSKDMPSLDQLGGIIIDQLLEQLLLEIICKISPESWRFCFHKDTTSGAISQRICALEDILGFLKLKYKPALDLSHSSWRRKCSLVWDLKDVQITNVLKQPEPFITIAVLLNKSCFFIYFSLPCAVRFSNVVDLGIINILCAAIYHFWVYTLRRVFKTAVSEYGRGQVTAPGRFPYSFREVCEFFKVPCIGLVKVERLGQWLNVPTQGQREPGQHW